MSNKPMTATCDAGCKKTFTITKIRTRKVKKGIEKNYFKCTHCRHEYVVHYASAETLKLQKDMRKLHVSMLGLSLANFRFEESVLKAKIKQSMDDARAIAEG